MNRITVRKVRAAYEKIGYKPIFGRWIDIKDKKCCPITAIILADDLCEDNDFYRRDKAYKIFGEEYVKEFLIKYDSCSDVNIESLADEWYNDGAIIRNFVLENYKHESNNC